MPCEKAALRLTVCNFVSNHIVILKLFLFAQINIKLKQICLNTPYNRQNYTFDVYDEDYQFAATVFTGLPYYNGIINIQI